MTGAELARGFGAAALAGAPADATLVLVNGRIHTMDARNTIARTVSIRNGRFVTVGDTAPKAAGVIHTDLQRGFIRAEVIGYDELVAAAHKAITASVKAAKNNLDKIGQHSADTSELFFEDVQVPITNVLGTELTL